MKYADTRQYSNTLEPESKAKSLNIEGRREPICIPGRDNEDVRPMVLHNCGNVSRGHFRIWSSLLVSFSKSIRNLIWRVFVTTKLAAVVRFVIMIPLRLSRKEPGASKRKDLEVLFFKRVQISGCLAAVSIALLFASSRPRAAESEISPEGLLASVDHKKGDAMLSGGWLSEQSNFSGKKGGVFAVDKRVQEEEEAADLESVLNEQKQIVEVVSKDNGSSFSGRRLNQGGHSASNNHGVSNKNNLSRAFSEESETKSEENAKDKRTLSQIVNGEGSMLSGGWLGSVNRGRAVSGGMTYVPGIGSGGNYQAVRENGPDNVESADKVRTLALSTEKSDNPMLSGGWLSAMASSFSTNETEVNQQSVSPGGGNQKPVKETGPDSAVPSNEEEIRVQAIDGGEEIYLPSREVDQNAVGTVDSDGSVELVNRDLGLEPTLFPDSYYDPVNNAFDFFGTYEAGVVGDRFSALATGTIGLPLFRKGEVNIDNADIKLGPVYIDFLYAGVGVLYSEFNGDQVFPEGQEPGFLSMFEFGFTTYVTITDQFYISMETRLIYLPQENRFGFALGSGVNAGLGFSFELAYEFEWGTWDFLLYDTFIGYPRWNLFSGTGFGETARQRAGRYEFGLNARIPGDNGANDIYDAYFVNTIGASATTPFLWQDWRLWLYLDHSDFWRTFDFLYDGSRDHFGVRFGYTGTEIPFAPYATYDVFSTDNLKSLYHTAYIGGRGRVTQNLYVNGRVGQLWSTNRDPDRKSILWELGLNHYISEDTNHSLYTGQTFEVSDFSNDTRLVEYIRYQINHRFSSRLSGFAFAQFSRDVYLDRGDFETNRQLYGARMIYGLIDYGRLMGSVFYETENSSNNSDFDRTSFIIRGEWDRRLGLRSTARLYYQFEKEEGRFNFDEHVLSLSLRRYF